MIHPDDINNADTSQVSQATLAVFDALQDFPVHVRALAGAAYVKSIVETKGLNPQDLMTTVGNLIDGAEKRGKGSDFKAVVQFIRDEGM